MGRTTKNSSLGSRNEMDFVAPPDTSTELGTTYSERNRNDLPAAAHYLEVENRWPRSVLGKPRHPSGLQVYEILSAGD